MKSPGGGSATQPVTRDIDVSETSFSFRDLTTFLGLAALVHCLTSGRVIVECHMLVWSGAPSAVPAAPRGLLLWWCVKRLRVAVLMVVGCRGCCWGSWRAGAGYGDVNCPIKPG